MKQWNGWGEDTITYDVTMPAWEYLGEILGNLQSHDGTFLHQHGVGTDHASFMPVDKGTSGMDANRSICKSFDPDGMMNPGKVFAG